MDKQNHQLQNAEKENRTVPFLAVLSLFFSFLGARLWVTFTNTSMLQHEGTTLGRVFIIKGLHIHHFFYGFVLLCIGGWIALTKRETKAKRVAAVLYGTGMGLFLDETGLLLTWGEYWSSLTYSVIFLVGILFLNVIYFSDFWTEVRNNVVIYSKEHLLLSKILRLSQLMEAVDEMSNKMSRTERASLIFSGFIYLGCGTLILIYPKFVYYWVAGAFFLASLAQFMRAIKV